jgi:hypothetical protein
MPGVVETTDTFTTNQVITSTLMNNIIDQTLFTSDAIVSGNTTLALVAGKLKVGTITSNEMGANAVTLNAIADGTITNAKVNASAAIALSKLATGALPTAITIASANIVDGTIVTADIADAAITAPKLDGAQTGTAPVFGVRAWVNFDGTTADNIGGTYSRTLTTVTVTTSVDHGLIVGHKVFLDFTSGGAADGAFVVTGITSSTVFTVTHGTSGTIPIGNVTLNRRLIRASGNVSSVSLLATGKYAVNFTTALPDANYARSGFANFNSSATAGFVGGTNETATTEQSCDINATNSTSGAENNFTVVNVMFVG